MPIIHHTPISMAALNFNITEDLDMQTFNIVDMADPVNAQDGATKNYIDTTLGLSTQGDLTATAPVKISDATRHLIGGAAALTLVNDAAATITEIDTGALANSDTRVPTSKAVRTALGVWATYAPTWTFTGGTPGSPTTTARYMQIGKTVFFAVSYTTADGNASTLTDISLPVTAGASAAETIVMSEFSRTTTLNLIMKGLISASGTTIVVTCGAATDGVAHKWYLSGFYEVD